MRWMDGGLGRPLDAVIPSRNCCPHGWAAFCVFGLLISLGVALTKGYILAGVRPFIPIVSGGTSLFKQHCFVKAV